MHKKIMSDKLTPQTLKSRKGQTPLVCLTAYDVNMARRLDPIVDVILVGDSLGMVLYGMETTTTVTLEMMIAHGKAVASNTARACCVVDMPFGTYENDPDKALRNAKRLMQETGCDALKLEGGQDQAAVIQTLTARGIPVMGHIGLQPQSVLREGGYKIKGRSDDEQARLIADAKAVEAAGAFSIVLEGTMEDAAALVTSAVSIPVIGIGASAACDGQILVSEDMLGLSTGHQAKFVKHFAQTGESIAKAVQAYAQDVRTRTFPAPAHTYRRKSG